MAQVIIVSNRLPVSVSKKGGKLQFYPSLGGLATGLGAYVKKRRYLWIGWPGLPSDDLNEQDRQHITQELAKHRCYPVFLSKKQIDDFYNGYSNQVLWPLFHNLRRPTVNPAVRRRYWQAYRTVNQQYADAAVNLGTTEAHIWVHDYQLLLVPEMIRAARSDIIMGFFLHTPWPRARALARLPEYKKLISGPLGADVAGFHTQSYVLNFLECCRQSEIGTVGVGEVVLGSRSVRIADFPMGIDYEKYATATASPEVKAAVKRYRAIYGRRKIIVSIDRMDPSKGLVERVKAYAALLERYPRLRGKVIFVMVAAPSRTEIPAYQRLAKRLQTEVNRVNKTFGTNRWQPLDFINVAQPFEEVTALFQIADVAFITPLKDGMNLAAKEFVASRRRGGVLILSETAGAAEELQDALLVNPAKPETMVEALHQALTMRRRELRRRLRRMQQQLSTNTVQVWAKDFVSSLNKTVPRTGTNTLKTKRYQQLVNAYRKADRRLLLLDYDGSLVPFSEDYRRAKPPESLIALLERLAADPTNDVVLISGRSSSDLKKWFGNLPLNLVAEHGAALKKPHSKGWQTVEKTDTEWKRTLQPILEKYTRLTPGARLEVKPHSLVWHYRGASPYYSSKYAITIKRVLKPALKSYGLELLQGNKALEIKSTKIGKGIAARRWLKRHYDFVLAIGDDATDEDIFVELPASSEGTKSFGVKVGRGRTLADYRLPSSKEVIQLLKKLY